MIFTGEFKLYDDQIFYEVGVIKNQLMYRWVYILATNEEAEKYQFCGKMKNKRGEQVNQKLYFKRLKSSKALCIHKQHLL